MRLVVLGIILFVALCGLSCANCFLKFEEKCNGQGIVYSDSQFSRCECFNCFSGENCENLDEDCVVDVAGGNPSLAQEFWENNTSPIGQSESLSYYRSPYELNSNLILPNDEPAIGITEYLRTAIFNIHSFVGNANTKDKYIVFGSGVTQMINAMAYACAEVEQETLPVFAQVPYFSHYKQWAEFNRLNNYWNGSYSQVDHEDNVIEFVTYPNNPTGFLRQPHYSNSKYQVHDMVYYWPSWLQKSNQSYFGTLPMMDEDIMMFSLSKLSGHGGSRFGYALIKSFDVALKAAEYISISNIHTSVDATHRAIRIMEALVDEDGRFFKEMSSVMKSRWSRLMEILNQQNKVTVGGTENFYYLWLTCEQGVNCYEYFKKGGIKGESGLGFGSTKEKIRIQLTVRSSDFELFMKNFQKLLLN